MSGSSIARLSPVMSVLLLAMGLQGCAPKIDCNGDQVKKDVVTIVQEGLDKAVWYKEVALALSGNASISDIKTVSKNDELKQAQCTAQYTFTYNKTQRQVEVEYNLSYLQDKKEVQVLAGADQVKTGIMQIVMREVPVKNGTQKIYNEAGKLVQSIDWKDNKKDGSQKIWTADGATLVADLTWLDGRSNGWEKYPDSSGKIITDLVWKDGMATGYQTATYAIGTPSEYVTLKDGKKNGPHRRYQLVSPGEDGLTLEDNYKDDKLDGLQRKYWNGKIEQETMYKDGVVVAGGQDAGAAAAPGKSAADKCVDQKIDAFHKESGMDAPINHDVLEEWTAQCAG